MTEARHAHRDSKTDTVHQAIDPVCGMTVVATSNYRFDLNGVGYSFCSAGCRDEFKAHPERFVKAAAGASTIQSADQIYSCPMHSDVRQTGPGKCPKCGMTLKPAS